MNVPFNNLLPYYKNYAKEINNAVDRVLKSGWYILGPEVASFEESFAQYHGLKYAVGVANGTDAIELSLRAANIGPGDEVITVSHTAVPTITAIERTGAKPVFVDVDPDTFTMNPKEILSVITSRTKALLPVHLYGQPADLHLLVNIAKKYKLLLVEDCAQAHGARDNNKLVGTYGHISAFSFYPTKNLGALGDGGAILTNDRQFADKAKRLRNYGQQSKYNHIERGMNSRLDEIQAAILKVKLKYLDDFNKERRAKAALYNNFLTGEETPKEREKVYHVYHLYVIKHAQRDGLQSRLAKLGVETLIHYPLPVHLQPAFADLGYRNGSLPVTESLCKRILSLPLYFGITKEQIKFVSESIKRYNSV